MKNTFKNIDGFTVIEVVVVLLILGAIAAITIPKITSSISDARKTSDVANGEMIADAANRIIIDGDEFLGLTSTAIDVNTIAMADETSGQLDEKLKLELYKELDENIPVPTYKGTDIHSEDNFILWILEDGTVEVYVGSGTDLGSTSVAIMIYPDCDSVYNTDE